MSVTAAEMLDAAGAKDITPFVGDNALGLTIHEMGTARMGRDPKTSVLNAHNQCHDVKNLFLTDGACMASPANQNPSNHVHCDNGTRPRLRGGSDESERPMA